MNRFFHHRVAVTTVATALTFSATSLPAAAATVSEPILNDLSGPLGLAIGNDGTIYVAQAFAGLLTTVDSNGTAATLVDGSGDEIAGVDARGKGTVVFTQTTYGVPGQPPAVAASLARVRPNGRTTTLLSTSDYETMNNPDGNVEYGFTDVDEACLDKLPDFVQPYTGIVETHPYAVAIVPGGYLIADAAGNDIIRVGNNGRASTVAVLPPVENVITAEIASDFELHECVVGATYWGESVPTDVEVGPDGHYYVSSLPGAPELPGTGSVWRIDSRTGDLTMVGDGLAGAVDIAVAADGTIYVAELDADQISKISGGTITPVVQIDEPGAIEIGLDDTLYATTNVFGPGALVTIDVS